MNLDYEIAKAEEDVEKAKYEAKAYLDLCSPTNIDWYEKFETFVSRIIKREKPELNFGPGGHPEWYSEAFRLFSNWISAEWTHCELLGKKIDSGL
jgi:hypothetical protein